MTYTFDVQDDPDYEGFFSIWIDNGQGCGAEIAGKTGSRLAADCLCAYLNSLSQERIEALFIVKGCLSCCVTSQTI